MIKRWFKRLDISITLQLSFLVSALLCLFVGVIGLYTWHQQRIEINFALDQDFPKVQAAFYMEDQLNEVKNAFVRLIGVKTTAEKITWYNHTKKHLNDLRKTLLIEADNNPDYVLLTLLDKLSALLEQFSDNMNLTLTLKDELNKQSIRINWLHNDFHSDVTALLQEMSWQQSTLANQLLQGVKDTPDIQQLQQVQQELLLVYELMNYEEQIITELKKRLTESIPYSAMDSDNYLNYLSLLVNNRIQRLDIHSSTYSIQQILNELIAIGLNGHELPALFQQRYHLEQERKYLTEQSNTHFHDFREQIDERIGNSKNQLRLLHSIVEKSTRFNGILVLISMIFACILLIAVNFIYIRLRLLKRFELLNQAVVQLSKGKQNVKVPIYGHDELGRIGKLLRLFLFEMNKKNQELERRNHILTEEIQHRILIENELVSTQNELMQTAKLAVVGKTLTSISHEITQPLNAMNAYLFSAKRTVNKQDNAATLNYLNKLSDLVERIALIIKRLRQFSRQGSGKLQTVNINQCIQNAWELLESKHHNRHARLIVPPDLPQVLGEDVLIEQVFVNLFLNSLEACEHFEPNVQVFQQHSDKDTLCLWISDNGKGWSLTEKLLQPFSSSKDINLGLGLSISQSIMQHCRGELLIASTLTHNALIILTFKVADNAN